MRAGGQAKGKGKREGSPRRLTQPVGVAQVLQAHRSNGTFILKTDRKELNRAQAYCLHKTRQDIAQAFKFYDDTLDGAASYMPWPFFHSSSSASRLSP